MSDKIIKQNLFVYNSEGVPIDITKYVKNHTISNGGIGSGATGVDGIVMTANMTIQNDIDINFNPEAEFGLLKTEIIPFIGDGSSTYVGVPTDVWTKAVSFNKIYNGTALTWDDLTTWDAFTSWNQRTGTTDRSGLYGNLKVSGSNFITPFIMPVGVLFEIIYTYIDYTEKNPINNIDDVWSPLLDENAKIEIYSLVENIKWMEYLWGADGTNSFDNPTTGTPLVSGIGIFKSRTPQTWDDLTTWDAWTSWEQDETVYDFSTNAYYDVDTDKIVLAATPDTGKVLTFSISYYEGTPEMIFSGYLGDSIKPNPEYHTIELSFRDKGKKLQDAMIDGITNVIDVSGWTLKSTSEADIINISEVDTTSGIFTSTAVHGLITGDFIRFNQVDSLPLQADGVSRLNATYEITVLSTTTFSLDGISFDSFTTTIPVIIRFTRGTAPRSINSTASTTAVLDFTANTLTYTIPSSIFSISDTITGVIYSDLKSLIYVEDSVSKEFKIGSNFISQNFVSNGGDVKVSTLDKDFQDIVKSIATCRKVKDFAEKGIAVSTITLATDTITTATEHLLEAGDIVSLSSTATLPSDADGLLEQFYEVGIVDSTNIKLYTRDSLGALELIDITNAGSGTITVISTQFDVVDVIRNILKDLSTVQGINIEDNIEVGYERSIGLNSDIWDSKTVWDTLQTLAAMKGLYIAYLWNEQQQDFVLTVKNLPAKSSADFTIASNGIHIQTQEITGADIRNTIFVNYYNSLSGLRESVSSIDTTSVARYGSRPSVITEGETSPINNPTIAQQFADAVLATSKDRIIESIATIPFQFKNGTDRIEVGNTVGLTYKYLDNTGGLVPYYAIESIEHTYNDGVYQTRLRGNKQQVRTSVRRYKKIESRPGSFRQNIGRDLSELSQIPAPTGLTLQTSGLETVSLSPLAYAIIQWKRPDNYYPLYYTLSVRRNDGTYAEGFEIKIDNTQSAIVTQRISLEPKVAYKCKVVAWSKGLVKGVSANEIDIDAIGDSVAPDAITGVSVVGLDEGLQVSFTPSTAGDLLGYKIYIRKGATPTTGTYDYRKVTNSTTTVFSGLGLEPGSYQVGVTAFDTSGNESTISSIVTTDNSPKVVIRTQAQMDAWVLSILSASTTPVDLDYGTVIIYAKSTPYIIGDSQYSTASKYFYPKSDYFQMIGVNAPEIRLGMQNNDIGLYMQSGGITGIKFLDGTVYGNGTVNINDTSTVDEYNYIDINNNSFPEDLNLYLSQYSNLTTTNNEIVGDLQTFHSSAVSERMNLIIKNNSFDLMEIAFNGVCNKLVIQENTILNTILFGSTTGSTVNEANIDNNIWNKTTSTYSPVDLLTGNTNIGKGSFTGNKINYSTTTNNVDIIGGASSGDVISKMNITDNIATNLGTGCVWLDSTITATDIVFKNNLPILTNETITTNVTAAAAGSLAGYQLVDLGGTTYKVPYYNET